MLHFDDVLDEFGTGGESQGAYCLFDVKSCRAAAHDHYGLSVALERVLGGNVWDYEGSSEGL